MEREAAKRFLTDRGWLSLLPYSVRENILSKTVLRTFKKGDAIYSLQDAAGGMYGLVKGSLGVIRAPGAGAASFIHSAGPGFWFGEGCVITGEPRRVGIIALSDVSALSLPLSSLHELIATDPTVWRYIALNAILNLDLTMRAYDDMKVRDNEMRITAILLRLAGYETPSFAPDKPCVIDISQAELAEIAGLSRTVVSRLLARLSRQRTIAIGYGSIELLDIRLLNARINQHVEN